MPFDFAAAKATAARVVHDTFKVEAWCTPPGSSEGVLLHVRCHSRQTLQGNLTDEGYADYIEGVDRVIFDADELSEKNVDLKRAWQIMPTSDIFMGVAFSLDAKEQFTGPIKEVWKVSRC